MAGCHMHILNRAALVWSLESIVPTAAPQLGFDESDAVAAAPLSLSWDGTRRADRKFPVYWV